MPSGFHLDLAKGQLQKISGSVIRVLFTLVAFFRILGRKKVAASSKAANTAGSSLLSGFFYFFFSRLSSLRGGDSSVAMSSMLVPAVSLAILL